MSENLEIKPSYDDMILISSVQTPDVLVHVVKKVKIKLMDESAINQLSIMVKWRFQ